MGGEPSRIEAFAGREFDGLAHDPYGHIGPLTTGWNLNYWRATADLRIVVDGQAPTEHFGLFDPSTATVFFWERSADLNAIVAEAERILARLTAVEDRGLRPPANNP